MSTGPSSGGGHRSNLRPTSLLFPLVPQLTKTLTTGAGAGELKDFYKNVKAPTRFLLGWISNL